MTLTKRNQKIWVTTLGILAITALYFVIGMTLLAVAHSVWTWVDLKFGPDAYVVGLTLAVIAMSVFMAGCFLQMLREARTKGDRIRDVFWFTVIVFFAVIPIWVWTYGTISDHGFNVMEYGSIAATSTPDFSNDLHGLPKVFHFLWELWSSASIASVTLATVVMTYLGSTLGIFFLMLYCWAKTVAYFIEYIYPEKFNSSE